MELHLSATSREYFCAGWKGYICLSTATVTANETATATACSCNYVVNLKTYMRMGLCDVEYSHAFIAKENFFSGEFNELRQPGSKNCSVWVSIKSRGRDTSFIGLYFAIVIMYNNNVHVIHKVWIQKWWKWLEKNSYFTHRSFCIYHDIMYST